MSNFLKTIRMNKSGKICSKISKLVFMDIKYYSSAKKFNFNDDLNTESFNFESKPFNTFGANRLVTEQSNRNGFGIEKQRMDIDWNKQTLKPFKKDFYKETKSVKNMSKSDIDTFRSSKSMLVFQDESDKPIPNPFRNWNESGLPDQCIEHIHGMGIKEPTPIQCQGIPMALSGNDIVGISRTGSGKTLAYLLPAIVHIQSQPVVERGEGPIGLILAPTRELCIQIDNEINKYMTSCNSSSKQKIILKHLAVYGGSENRSKQINGLRRNSPDILVATPGRLIDLYESGETNFLRTTYVVLDEADRMLDMGFRDDLTRILKCVRPDRQVLMWSATWPKEIQHIARRYMSKPFRVQIGSTDLHANSNIEQNFRLIRDLSSKNDYILKDIEEVCINNNKKCLIFTNTKRDSDKLELILNKLNNINPRAIHGDKSQTMRERILSDFRNGYCKCLIATDVVARGIDIKDIAVVLNYDFPSAGLEQYVHRIGRTARGHDGGVSLTYLTMDDTIKHNRGLIPLLKKANQNIPKWMNN